MVIIEKIIADNLTDLTVVSYYMQLQSLQIAKKILLYFSVQQVNNVHKHIKNVGRIRESFSHFYSLVSPTGEFPTRLFKSHRMILKINLTAKIYVNFLVPYLKVMELKYEKRESHLVTNAMCRL